MTPSGIEPATFRFVAQHLNHCTTAVHNRARYRFNFSAIKPKLPRLISFSHTFFCLQFPSGTMIKHSSSTNEQKPKNQRQSNNRRSVSQSSALCACFETVESQSSEIYGKINYFNALVSVYIYQYYQRY